MGRSINSTFTNNINNNSKSSVGISGSSSLASFLTLEFKKEPPKPIPLTLGQKWSKLLFNEEFSDVHIRVGSESKIKEDECEDSVVFPCHKLVLAANSPFFWNLFRSMEDLSVIRFIQFSPESIHIFLKFLYTEELEPRLWESHEVLLHILELSEKFQVVSLKLACIENFSKLDLTPDNVLSIWVRGREYQEKELEDFAIKHICLHADTILRGGGAVGGSLPQNFLDLSHADLKALIRRDDFQVNEYVLFNAVFQWAKHKCKEQGQPPTGPFLRRILNDVIYLIRFPLMSTTQFTNVIIPKGILSADEVSKILRLIYLPSQYESDADLIVSSSSSCPGANHNVVFHNNNNNNTHSGGDYADDVRLYYYSFNKKPRLRQGKIFTVSRFGAIGREEKFFGDKFYSVRFLANKSIALVGFAFYGPGPGTLRRLKPTDKMIFDIQVHLRKFDGSLFTFAVAQKSIVVTKEKWEKYRDCHKKLPAVNFDFPITIQSQCWYHIQYRINGASTMTGHEASRKLKASVHCKDHGEITFQFLGYPDQNPEENQLPDLIFKFF